MKSNISVPALATLTCVAVLTLGASGAAQAQDDVYWSIGMSAPGMQVGVSNAPTVVVRPPMYVLPPPVYVPRVVYESPREVYYRQAQPVYYGYGRREYRDHDGYRGYGWRGEERFEHERYEHGREQFERQRQGGREGRSDGRSGMAQVTRNFEVRNR